MALQWLGLFLYILLLARFSSLSHEIAFDSHFHKPKPEHLIADVIHDVLFYLLLTIAPRIWWKSHGNYRFTTLGKIDHDAIPLTEIKAFHLISTVFVEIL